MTIDRARPADQIPAPINLSRSQAPFEFLELCHNGTMYAEGWNLQVFLLKNHATQAASQMLILALVEPKKMCDQISIASHCPDFAARHFPQTPLATSLPQDSSRALMFQPCANRISGASTSLHWNLAALREPHLDHARN
jgi:hypothetical protein